MINNLDAYNRFLNGRTAWFMLDCVLGTPDIVTRPTPAQIYNILIHCAKDFSER